MNSWAASKFSPDSNGETDLSGKTSSLITVKPSTPWDQVAIARFLDNFTLPTTRGAAGHLEYLPELLKSPSESLQEATLASSFAHLGNVSCMRSLVTRSEVHHGRALRALNTALQNPATAKTDETLATVILLVDFEVGTTMQCYQYLGLMPRQIISGIGELSQSPHDQGAAEILRQRRSSPPQNAIGGELSQNVQRRSGIQAVCNGWSHPNVPSDEQQGQNAALGPLIWPLLLETSSRRSSIESAITLATAMPDKPSGLEEALQEAELTLGKLRSWPQTVPIQWKYRSVAVWDEDDLGPVPQDCQDKVFAFHSLQHGTLWMLYWLTCIHLAQALKNGYGFLSNVPEQQRRQSSIKFIQDLDMVLLDGVSSILGCAPFLLGDIDEQGELRIGEKSKALGAFFLLRGLGTASSVIEISDRQRRSIMECFDRIGLAFGIKRALVAKAHWLACWAAQGKSW